MFSDNATNFSGDTTQDELLSLVLSSEDQINDFCRGKGIDWHFHPPLGSHHAGHYERLIKSVKRALNGLTNEQEMSEDNLTTFLCEAEKIVNDRPLTSVSSNPDDNIPLTPNTILLLNRNSCAPLFQSDNVPKLYHRQAQYLADIFWKRWLKEYVPSIAIGKKWLKSQRNLKIGDIVFMTGEGYKRGNWPIARVVEVYPCPDGLVRKVLIKDKNGFKERPITKLALLESID